MEVQREGLSNGLQREAGVGSADDEEVIKDVAWFVA
jgi:hypothetical protein